MTILYIVKGAPGHEANTRFVEWAWHYFYHQKELGALEGISVKEYCEAMYSRHFIQWEAADKDENGQSMYWP